MPETIHIKAQGADSLPIEQITQFQGELKSLSKEAYEMLKSQLLELGFCEPITIWKKQDGTHLLANGHQRLRTLLKMKEDGHSIPYIPVSYVHPNDEQEFAKIVLSLCSQYGEVEKQGLYEYMSIHNIPVSYAETRLRLPEIRLPQFKSEFYQDLQEFVPDTSDVSRLDQLAPKIIKCPNCNNEFDIRKIEN